MSTKTSLMRSLHVLAELIFEKSMNVSSSNFVPLSFDSLNFLAISSMSGTSAALVVKIGITQIPIKSPNFPKRFK